MEVFVQCICILFALVGMFVFHSLSIEQYKEGLYGLAVFNSGVSLLLLLNWFANTLQLFKQLGWISY